MIIGIGGVSRSGKSTLAKHIVSSLGPNRCALLHQDDFVKPKTQLPVWKQYTDWEHPRSIDFEKMAQALDEAEFKKEFTVIEGFLIYWNKSIRDLINLKIFIQIDKAEFLKRKRFDKRWKENTEEYFEHIWDSYLRFGQVNDNYIDMHLNGADQAILSFDIKPHLG